MVAQIGVEPLAAHGLHRLADEIDVGAVFPARAGIGHQRRLQRRVLAGGDAGRAGLLQIGHHVAVPHVVGKAGGVGHEVAQRDRILRRPQFRRAIGVETFEHLRRRPDPAALADRRVERELALLDQLHAGRRSDGLGHGGDPEHAVGGHRPIVLGQVALAERALVDHLFAVRGHRDHAGNLPGVAFLTQNLIDLSLALHGVTSRLFFETGRSSSRPRPLARASNGRQPMSRSRDGGGCGTVGSGCGQAAKLPHSPQFTVNHSHCR